jgi:hypothetical protein
VSTLSFDECFQAQKPKKQLISSIRKCFLAVYCSTSSKKDHRHIRGNAAAHRRSLTLIEGKMLLSPRSNAPETQGLSKDHCEVGGGSTTFSACEESKTQLDNRVVKKFALTSAIPIAKMQQII